MFSWGENCRQGFRLRDDSNVSTDAGVHFLNLSCHIRDLSAGHSVLGFVKTNGEAFVILTKEGNDGRRFREQQKFVRCKEKIQAVSCGDDAVTLLSEKGSVLCVDTNHTPRPLEVLCNIAVSQVACGSQHSVALTKDGQVYTWGQDSRGQLGLGRRKPGTSSPQHLQSVSEIPLVQVAAGGEQSFALSVSGGVFSWGRNDCGQLGLGDTTDRHKPTPVYYLNMKKTVHISCGKDHTATLTKGGAVFTFGSGQHGQLGHNSFSNELRPRLVAELWGAKVIQIACGRYHTLMLTDSSRVYSCGRGEQAQLGHGNKTPFVPLRVPLPQDTIGGLTIRNISAGGDCSFAVCMSKENVHQRPNTDKMNNATHHSIDGMITKWMSACDSKSRNQIKSKILRMFSSASCVNRSFLDQHQDKHFQTSPNYSGLDLSLAQQKLEELIKRDVSKKVEDAVLQLLPSLDNKQVGVEGLRIYLLLNELLYVIQKHKLQPSTELALAAAGAIQRLSAENLRIIGDWWASLSAPTLARYVEVWKEALSAILSTESVPLNHCVLSGVKNLLQVLQHMHNVNNRIPECQRIPENTYCLGITQELLEEDVMLWRSKSKTKGKNYQPLILCKFPFVMDLNSKKKAFEINAKHTKEEHQVTFSPLLGWIPPSESYFFELRLKRASLLEGCFEQLTMAQHSALKKPLVVYFDEDPKVTAVYKRDFFHHLFCDMVSAKPGMFVFNDSKTLVWFPSKATKEDRANFFLFGLLCGLALYNQCIIHLSFPLALFKKLLDIKPTLEDMMEFSPTVGESLQCILDYEDDVLEDLDQCFSITWDGREVNLDPQHPGKLVTGQNKKEFVEAYVNHAFNTSVKSVFQEFKRGFFRVCDPDMVKLFRPGELQGVLVGKDLCDWAKLKRNTRYEIYHFRHPTIQMFWEVFDELSEEQKMDFLWFVTGFRRVPVLGMDQIKIRIRIKLIQSGSYDQHFPESLTCHSILELPMYSTKEIMQERLTHALIPETAFLK